MTTARDVNAQARVKMLHKRQAGDWSKLLEIQGRRHWFGLTPQSENADPAADGKSMCKLAEHKT